MAKTSNLAKHTSRNPLKRFFLNNFEQNLTSVVAPLNPLRILDAGCGEGFTLLKLYELKVGKELAGIDYSRVAIGTAREMFPYLNVKVGDIYKLPFKENSFDLVICTEVFEHLENPVGALKEIERVASKYALITVPNEPWFTFFNFTQWGKDIGHINHWGSASFQKFVEHNSKFKIISKKHPFPWTMILVKKQ